jgi:hypothetical protein
MKNLRIVDREAQQIDYYLNILGIRVWRSACQLIARSEGKWTSIGPKHNLPIDIPRDEPSLREAGSDTLRLTAWQYEQEHPGTDIRAVLSAKKDFDSALRDRD